MDSPIFITGIERSGSSIVAHMIAMCGVWTGTVTEMCENIYIKQLVDQYYRDIQADVRGQYPLPVVTKLPQRKLIVQINKILLAEGWDGLKGWMYKSSRLCQTWPLWHQNYPTAKWVVVRRRTGDIINSCLKTGFMTAYKNGDGWKAWIHEHERRFVEMISAGVNVKIIWPDRMMDGDFVQMKETIEWLGLQWNEQIEEYAQLKLKRYAN